MKLLLKAIGYRLVATLTTALVAFALTGDARLALGVGAADSAVKVLLYWWYDVAWARVAARRRKASVVWLTGLSGAGKTTLAREMKRRLDAAGQPAMILDGDEIRSLFPGTGFDEASRKAHIMRVGEMAAFLQAQGVTAIVSLISPYRDVRDRVRSLSQRFIEVYVATPLVECEGRDPKGLYRRARSGELAHFTGIDAPYEAPITPDVVINTTGRSVGACAGEILRAVRSAAG